jgi:2-oxoglutarate dehydrogenase E2 component (dihydrolipoamide succinyltransferase)
MAIAELVMPKLGESIMEATILKWYKNVGDLVKLDETVLDIATDKVDSEVPSTYEGIIKEILFNVNDIVPIGTVIARIEVASAAATVAPSPAPAAPIVAPTTAVAAPIAIPPAPLVEAPTIPTPIAPVVEMSAPPLPEVPYTPASPVIELMVKPASNRFYSPLVLNIANSEGVSLSELERIPGTGNDNRVSKRDILQYIVDKKAGRIPVYQPAPQQPVYTAPQPIPAVAAPIVMAPAPIITAPAPIAAAVVPEVMPIPTPIEPIVEVAMPPQIATPVAETASAQVPAPAISAIPVTIPEPVNIPAAPTAPIIATVQTAPIYTAPTEIAPNPITPSVPLYTPPVTSLPVVNKAIIPSGIIPDPSAIILTGATEIVEMDRMRKLIAKHMVESKHTSPHVTSFAEADVTNMVLWREKIKKEFEQRESTKLTFTPIFIECIASVIKRFPYINCSLDGDKIILKKDINIGMATALPSGNLIVPVIKGADQMNIVGLSKAVNSLADAARNGRLKPEDTTGGTFTLTNVGSFGSLMGTPIINMPQVAIMAVGIIKKRPMVIETPEGDTIAIRHMMYLSLSYDHRIVDGSIGASFLSEVAKEFEKWDINKQWFHYL